MEETTIASGGELLKWLFGTSTDKDLKKLNLMVSRLNTQEKITHLPTQQASHISESLWESQAELIAIEKLAHTSATMNLTLHSVVNQLDSLTTLEETR